MSDQTRGLGYDLWLARTLLPESLRDPWLSFAGSVVCEVGTAVLESAAAELERSLAGLLGIKTGAGSAGWVSHAPGAILAGAIPSGSIIAGRPDFIRKALADLRVPGDSPSSVDSATSSVPSAVPAAIDSLLVDLPPADGYEIRLLSDTAGTASLSGTTGSAAGSAGPKPVVLVAANNDRGVLYGVFALLRAVATGIGPDAVNCRETPAVSYRMLDHWDNLDGSIERGYAGNSLWNWAELPGRVDQRYSDYARACASVGINASCLNNVNAACEILSSDYLVKIAAIAKVLRAWGIRTFLSVNFSSPIKLGGLETADPLDPAVAAWWRAKAGEIYSLIPDFGGFVVKADSEGQPGPFAYGRTHADGANMLARALKSFGGIVIWRAFVYGHGETDRAKKAWANFMPHDGEFESNVTVQVKNGAIDFQPREPVHPLFGSMEKSSLFMEFQVTQEYLGQGNHVVYLGPMWKEILDFDTHARGKGSTVARLLSVGGGAQGLDAVDRPSRESARTAAASGNAGPATLSGIAGVSNIGNNDDWCGSLFHPLNWYAFGRLAWNPAQDTDSIAREWIAQTWGPDDSLIRDILAIVSPSWDACVDYMTPLCLHHIMREHHHYGPDPAFNAGAREDWRSTYYHRGDSVGLGFDRTRSGSEGVDQYRKPVADMFNDIATCPEKYLLWFHHVKWNHVLASGRTLAEELPVRYARGVAAAETMRDRWVNLASRIDPDRHAAVLAKLDIQVADAREWESVCVPYFLGFVKGGKN